MGELWHYARGQQSNGPVTFEQLKLLASNGGLLPSDLVWHDGMETWVAASSITDLSFESAAPFENLTGPLGPNFPEAGIQNTRELSDREMGQIRNALTAYADSIPHHGVQDFGSRLDFVRAFAVPVYSISVKTSYDKREVIRREEPYLGWQVLQQNTSTDSLDVWKYTLNNSVDFAEGTREHKVADSESIGNCIQCSATGIVTCSGCGGGKQILCPQCGGATQVNCSTCSGKGVLQQFTEHLTEVRCTGHFLSGKCNQGRRVVGGLMDLSNMGNHGRITGEICPVCKGTGFTVKSEKQYFNVPCTRCSGGKMACDTCSATGHVTCNTCGGTGQLICERCKGNKRLASYLCIKQSFSLSNLSRRVPCSQTDETVMARIKAQDFNPVIHRIADALPDDPTTTAGLDSRIIWINENIKSVIADTRKAVSPESHIAKQELDIKQSPMLCIEYGYAGESFVLWLVGSGRTPFSISSPFQGFVQTLLQEALRAWNGRNGVAANQYYIQCCQVAERDACCEGTLKGMADQIPLGLKTAAKLNAGVQSVKNAISKLFH